MDHSKMDHSKGGMKMDMKNMGSHRHATWAEPPNELQFLSRQ